LQGLQAEKYVGRWHPVITFDSVSVYPLHFRLTDEHGHAYDTTSFGFDAVHARIIWHDSLHPDSIRLTYYRYPPWWYARPRALRLETVSHQGGLPPPQAPAPSFFEGLQTKGIWEQGLMGGNRQQGVPQTRLDLHINGSLSDQVHIHAHIKDDNLPMGYEGVTTTFKDLNRVFIHIQGPHWQLGGGDSLWQFRSDLLKFDRDNRGMAMSYAQGSWKISMAAASVKGRFKRQEFDLQTNQYGPFLLLSENGQRNIYLLHGSEKVYLNGHLLRGGENGDYTMDYMKARLTLKPGLRINQGDRLVVEYQYAALDFARWSSLVTAEHTSKSAQWRFFSYNETDLARKTLLIPLDSQAIALLRQVPQASTVWIPAEKPVPYSPEKILYKKITAGGTSFYQYSTDSTAILYEVRFSYAGQGRGDYILDRYLAAGPVYSYAGPGRGDYLPGYPLRPPANRRFTGLHWQTTHAHWQTYLEGVYQYTNPNLWYQSTANRRHAIAWAWEARYRQQADSGWFAGTAGRWLPSAYHSPDPITPDHLARDWGLMQWPVRNYRFTQVFGGYRGGKAQWLARQSFLSQPGRLHLKQSAWHGRATYPSWQGEWEGALTWGRWQSTGKYFYQQWNARWRRTNQQWQPYLLAQVRRRHRQANASADSLNFNLYHWEAGIETRQHPWTFKGWIRQNRADSIRDGHWQIRSNELMAGLAAAHTCPYNSWNVRLQWVRDPVRHQAPRWDMNISARKQDSAGVYNWHIEAGRHAMRLLRNEIIYKEVPAGEGQYQWVDYNGDGIAQNNEFEPAYYQDQANYIMVVLPSTYTLPVVNNRLLWESRWHPNRLFRHAPFWARWDFRLRASSSVSWESNRWISPLKAFEPAQTADQRIRYLQQWQPSSSWLFSYRLDWHRQKQLTYNGHQGRFLRHHQWAFRYTASPHWYGEPYAEQILAEEWAEDYPLKNYQLNALKWGLRAGYEGQQNGWKWTAFRSRQISQRGNRADSWQIQAEGHSNRPGQQWGWRLTYAHIRFRGHVHSPDGFRMLQGMLPGHNLIGELHAQRRLRQNLYLQFFYQLRYTPTAGAVHTGNISIKARF
jgi:hypothetical protein